MNVTLKRMTYTYISLLELQKEWWIWGSSLIITIFTEKNAPPYKQVHLLTRILNTMIFSINQYLVWPPPATITAAICYGFDSLSFSRLSEVLVFQTFVTTSLRNLSMVRRLNWSSVAISLWDKPTFLTSIITLFSLEDSWGIVQEEKNQKFLANDGKIKGEMTKLW